MPKFITEESIQKICNKYNLLFGSSNIYVGGIPDKNVNHIKNFKIDKEDKLYIGVFRYNDISDSIFSGLFRNENYEMDIDDEVHQSIQNGNLREFPSYVEDKLKKKYKYERRSSNYELSAISQEVELQIIAPMSDFDTTNMKIQGHQIVKHVPDPIVLAPVFYKQRRYYLIVTAWGLEASDELVTNERMN